MDNQQLIYKTADFMKQKFKDEASGHDWWHIYRVWSLAKYIASQEKGANLLIVELAALLHDIADWKFHDDPDAGPKAARQWLESLGAKEDVIGSVEYIVRYISYKGGTNTHVMQTLEGKIVQDADRLDALGAIGIARTFAFGGAAGRSMYEPDVKPQIHKDFEKFKRDIGKGTTINHFHEKLLLIADKMSTDTGKKLAKHRHKFLEDFLEEFHAEWDGKL